MKKNVLKKLISCLIINFLLLTFCFAQSKPLLLLKKDHPTIPYNGFLFTEKLTLNYHYLKSITDLLEKVYVQKEEYLIKQLTKVEKKMKVYFWQEPEFNFLLGLSFGIFICFAASNLTK